MTLILSGTDGLSDVDGSAATPAIRGTDTNTGIFFPAADTIAFSEGGTESMRIDSSGNVGVGVTPGTWSDGKVIEINTAGNALWGEGNYTVLLQNARYNGGYKYARTGVASSHYDLEGGSHKWYTAPSGTAGNAISFTQAMTLDASGNLGVGPTSISAVGSQTVLAVGNSSGGTVAHYQSGSLAYRTSASTSSVDFFTPNSVPLIFYTAGSERARIDNGNLLVGTTTGAARVYVKADGAIVDPVTVNNTNTTANSQYAILFVRNSSTVGSIQTTNSATSYNTSSDYRLKENIAPMTGALATVAALKPCTYTWKVDGSAGQGFIAHELAEVVPDCVTGEKDATRMEQYEISPAVPATYDEEGNELTPAVAAVMGEREVPVYQGIDTSFLVATLTAAIQELKAINDAQAQTIQSLTARIEALEGK